MTVRVWDVPTRLVHWLMVVGVGVSWWTAETGRMDWHRWSGYLLLALLLFRVFWGFFGGSTARFSQFVRGPRVVLSYLKGTWAVAPGHNPLGALSVLALLGLMLTQVILGLFAIDVDGIESGPLTDFVSFDAGRRAAGLHESLFNVLMIVILLHIVAVLFYWVFRKQNLVESMVTGRRAFTTEVAPLTAASWVRVVIGAVLAALITWLVTAAYKFS